MELLHLIEILEYIHTEVQGIITSPHLVMTLLYDVLRGVVNVSKQMLDCILLGGSRGTWINGAILCRTHPPRAGEWDACGTAPSCYSGEVGEWKT